MQERHILLAEDSVNDAELMLAALEDERRAYHVVVARDGADTLDYLYRRGRFAERPPGDPILVLLDLKMPKLGGLEALRVIKNDPLLKVIPVVVLTSSREERDIVEAYQLGANAYVVKPVEFDDLVGLVKQLGLFWAVHNEPPPSQRKG